VEETSQMGDLLFENGGEMRAPGFCLREDKKRGSDAGKGGQATSRKLRQFLRYQPGSFFWDWDIIVKGLVGGRRVYLSMNF